MRNKICDVILGIFFIVIGVGFAGNVFGLWDFHLFFKGWWTVFIIVPFTVSIIREGANIGNIIGLVVGVMLLLSAQDILDFSLFWKLLVPGILVLIGIRIILGPSNKKFFCAEINNVNKNGKAEYVSIFSGRHINFSDKNFEGAEATSVFGGITIKE